MKNFKKAIASLTVTAMLLGTMATSFAATTIPSDVVGTAYEAPVGKLIALNIVGGRDDGTFDAEATLTRAEAAKIMVNVLGMGATAEASKGPTKFSDVPADHWASGYINTATETAIIKGVGGGLFNPNGKVKVSECVTMAVRAIGLGPVVEGNGTWPNNYMVRADQEDLFEDVKIDTATSEASRGDFAAIAWNTLMAEKWGETEYTSTGIVFGPQGKTLLTEKFKDYATTYVAGGISYVEAKYYEELTVAGTPFTGEDADKINLVDNKTYPTFNLGNGSYEVDVADVDYFELLGKKVNVLFGKNDKIVFLQVVTADTAEGELTDIDLTEEKIKIGDKKYSVKDDTRIRVNLADIGEVDTTTDDALTALYNLLGNDTVASKVTALLDDYNVIETLNVFIADAIPTVTDVTTSEAYDTYQGMVEEIEDDEISFYNAAIPAIDVEELDDEENIYGSKTLIVKDGKAVESKDIKVGDIVTYITNSDDIHYLVVSSETVSGEVSNIISIDSMVPAPAYKMTIGNKTYKTVVDGTALMSKSDDLDDVDPIAALGDFDEADVTIHLNNLGRVMYISAEVEESVGTVFGVVSKYTVGSEDKFTVVLPNGNTKRLTVDFDSDSDDEAEFKVHGVAGTKSTLVGNIAVGDVVQYKLDSDGVTIPAKSLIVYKAAALDSGVTGNVATNLDIIEMTSGAAGLTVKKNAETIKFGGNVYQVDEDTVIFNRSTTGTDKIEATTWEAIYDATNGFVADVHVVYSTNSTARTVKYIIIDTNGAGYTVTSRNFGLYIGTREATDGDEYARILLEDGNIIEAEVATGDPSENNLLVEYGYKGDKFELKRAVESYDEKVETVKASGSNYIITFEDDEQIIVSQDAIVFDATEEDVEVVTSLTTSLLRGNYIEWCQASATDEDIEEGDYIVIRDAEAIDMEVARIANALVAANFTIAANGNLTNLLARAGYNYELKSAELGDGTDVRVDADTVTANGSAAARDVNIVITVERAGVEVDSVELTISQPNA